MIKIIRSSTYNSLVKQRDDYKKLAYLAIETVFIKSTRKELESAGLRGVRKGFKQCGCSCIVELVIYDFINTTYEFIKDKDGKIHLDSISEVDSKGE